MLGLLLEDVQLVVVPIAGRTVDGLRLTATPKVGNWFHGMYIASLMEELPRSS